MRASAALLVLLFPASAFAGNNEAVFLGNQAAMNGGAVVAWVDDGGAPWYNPAGIANVERTSVDLSASAFVLRHHGLPDAAQTRVGDRVESADASFTEVVSVPAALTLMRRLSDGVAGALFVYVPHQEDVLVRASFNNEGTSQPDYRWSFSATRRLARYYAGLGVGFRVSEAMRFGFSLFGTYESQVTARDFASTLESSVGDTRRAVITVDRKLQSKLFGTSWVLGWRWDVDEHWSVGTALRGPVLHLGGFTDVDIGGTSSRVAADGSAQVSSSDEQLEQDPATFSVTLPASIQLGVSRRIGDGRVSAQFEWQSAASGGARVRKAIWNVRAGGMVSLSEQVSLGGGLFTDQSPDQDATTLGAQQVDFYGGSLGGQFNTPHDVTIDGEPAGLVLSTTVALRYAIGIGEVGSLLFDPFVAPSDDVADVTIHELSLHIGSGIDF